MFVNMTMLRGQFKVLANKYLFVKNLKYNYLVLLCLLYTLKNLKKGNLNIFYDMKDTKKYIYYEVINHATKW